MNQATTPYHSRWYRERTSTYWWMSSWPYFAFLIVTAVALYYAKGPILVIAAIVGICKAWLYLCHRFPRTMRVVNRFVAGFIRGLSGGGRRNARDEWLRLRTCRARAPDRA